MFSIKSKRYVRCHFLVLLHFKMCMTPLTLKSEDIVPCGQCPECKARRVSAWSFRLMQQDKVSRSSIFLTLTYDSAHVPITKAGYMSLAKRDVQLFIKRLRKLHKRTDSILLRYYAVGEYGGRTWRPHYHIILFNSQPELIEKAWALNGQSLGLIHFGYVCEASVGYTLKYINKPKGLKVPTNRNDDRQPEFSLMSKGLGISYLTEKMCEWHADDPVNRMYCNLPDGKKITMPRYFKEKIFFKEERQLAAQANLEKQRKAYDLAYDQDPNFEHNQMQAIEAAFRNQELKVKKLSNNKI